MNLRSEAPMLERFSGFESNDADRAAAALIDDLGATCFNLPAGKENFSLKLHWSKRTNLTMVSGACDAETDLRYSPATFVRQYFEMNPGAYLRFSAGSRTSELSSFSAPMLVPAETSFRVQSTANLNLLVLRIEQEILKQKMASLLGEQVSDLKFEQQATQETPAQCDMKRSVVQFASDLDRWGPEMLSLARMDLEQALIVRFLFCNCHNLSQKLATPAAAPSLLQLRNVESYIEANWNRPLDVESLARISNISARSLFRYFKEMRGVSPREFMKAIRLKRARILLQDSAPNSSVMTIALTCGFQSLGHFAREYRTAFGELPSETLKRSRPLPT